MQELELPRNQWAEFWALHYVTVDDNCTSHRTQCTFNVKKAFEKGMEIFEYSHYLYCYSQFPFVLVFIDYHMKKLDETMITFVENLLKKDEFDPHLYYDDQIAYASLFKAFARGMIPAASFKMIMREGYSKFDDLFSDCTEAFLLVILESNLPKWKHENVLKYTKNQDNPEAIKSTELTASEMKMIPLPRYTLQRGDDNQLKTGWTSEGIRSYNYHLERIRTFRSTQDAKSYGELAILNYNQQLNGSKKRKRSDREKETSAQEIIALDEAYNVSWNNNKFR